MGMENSRRIKALTFSKTQTALALNSLLEAIMALDAQCKNVEENLSFVRSEIDKTRDYVRNFKGPGAHVSIDDLLALQVYLDGLYSRYDLLFEESLSLLQDREKNMAQLANLRKKRNELDRKKSQELLRERSCMDKKQELEISDLNSSKLSLYSVG